MNETLGAVVADVCRRYGQDRHRMMDILLEVQQRLGCVSGQAIQAIARETSVPRVEVESVASFYAFLSRTPRGRIVIRLCNDIIDELQGAPRVAEALSAELGIGFGETTPDGAFSLAWTPCIGMSDQAPAALVNDVVVTHLDRDKATWMVQELRRHGRPDRLVKTLGDGNNAHDLVHAMVCNNIRREGPVVLAPFESGSALHKALAMTPAEVIRHIKTSRLRGRGGAGFPTGIKWDFTRQAEGRRRFVLCNGDEGEPGTFKDRVILTERAGLMFEGMTIAGYAIGADTGILYLRAEYAYLRNFLDDVLARRRAAGLLGKNVGGRKGFDFDIRIQMGAGAYVCGEETALIHSCEGGRGDPKNRPPFPAQKGYLGCPTTVNNVETFCCAARILDRGAGWFAEMGSKGSPGTKLLSVSGDCTRPGVYEVPFGIRLGDLLDMVGGRDAAAVQVGGPSGQMVGPDAFDRTLCYDDLATGGSVMVFSPDRDVLHVVSRFLDFFVEESCGYCTPCRVGNALLHRKIEDLREGRGEADDLAYLEALGRTVKLCSRCGLGQTSPNPVLSTLANFRSRYDAAVRPSRPGPFRGAFDIRAALREGEALARRSSTLWAAATPGDLR